MTQESFWKDIKEKDNWGQNVSINIDQFNA